MNFFQLLVLGGLAFLLLLNLISLMKGWTTRRESLIATMVCLVAAIATAWPQTTVRVANALGIGRGADLVFYCAVVVMMIGFWMVYIRLRQLRREITLLVRHIAIQEAQRK
jgi:hypothetical protein